MTIKLYAMVLVTPVLDGTNYHTWSRRGMKRALL